MTVLFCSSPRDFFCNFEKGALGPFRLGNVGLKPLYWEFYYSAQLCHFGQEKNKIAIIIPRQSRRDIVLASSVHSVRPSIRTFCLSGTISQYLLDRFNSFLVQMISTMDF